MGKGGIAISAETINFIKSLIPEKSTILEMGSGPGTVELAKHFTMYSVENDYGWMSQFIGHSNFIYCPLKYYDYQYTAPDVAGIQKAWYNTSNMVLPESYDLILIDGPGGPIGRGGFLKHIDMFNTNVPLLFDDINREAEFDLMKKVSEKLNRPYFILESDNALGYIL